MIAVVLFSIVLIEAAASIHTYAASSGTLVKSSSGLVASDPLTQTLSQSQLSSSSYWSFGGSAQDEGVQYNYYEDSSGLHIGNIGTNSWAGFYAVSPNTNFMLVHVRLSQSVSTVPSGAFESGLYVQTYNGLINYVTCYSYTSSQGTLWAVDYATGNTQQANSYVTLYHSPLGQPLARDCTIITNGQNYLKVYFDGVLAYQSSSLNLNIPAPFQVYLEPESSYTGAELYTTFQNYYVTTGEFITVNGLPSNAATAQLVNPNTNTVLASAPVSGGSSSIEAGNFVFPLNAIIRVVDSSNNVVASTPSAVGLYGGDVYTYSASTTTTSSSSSTSSSSTTSSSSSSSSSSTATTSTSLASSTSGMVPLTVNTINQNGNTITGYYVALLQNGQQIGSAFSPATFQLQSGTTYTII
ncbi:MAG TPA: hypothetical protein VFF30_01735, partial [Nitrososphaerales archaeon]|nr:hypothetical protein [Nitrososphaerales archaeon]